MKRALITIATVGILVPTAWVAGANAQYSSPPPPAYNPAPAYNPSPAYSPSQGYNPSPRYTRRAYRRSARQTSRGYVDTPGSGPPPYSVSAQTYASQSQGPYEWYAGPGPMKRANGMCVEHVDSTRGYGIQKRCPAPQGQRAALNPQPLPPSGGGEARRSR
jgi:hypothetical protein